MFELDHMVSNLYACQLGADDAKFIRRMVNVLDGYSQGEADRIKAMFNREFKLRPRSKRERWNAARGT